jgi:hypothetical protein
MSQVAFTSGVCGVYESSLRGATTCTADLTAFRRGALSSSARCALTRRGRATEGAGTDGGVAIFGPPSRDVRLQVLSRDG